MQEQFWILTLDVRKCPIAWHLITQGVLDATMVHTREVFRPAILDGADSMILMHNHPSGDATPGDVDFRTTKRLAAASVNIGIHILDHIVVGNFAVSLRETKPDIFAI
jgi:DNA repair protein RadC